MLNAKARQMKSVKLQAVKQPRRTTRGSRARISGMHQIKSNKVVHTAMQATAYAVDTVCIEGIQEGASQMHLFFVDINQVKDGRAEGGMLSPQDATREKTRVIWVGPSSDGERLWAIEQMTRSLKHDNKRSKTHQRVDLFPNENENPMSVVSCFL